MHTTSGSFWCGSSGVISTEFRIPLRHC